MMNIDKLKKAIDDGMNDVKWYPGDSGGIVLTLSHSITSDNTVTLFIPRNADMVFWAEAEDKEINEFHKV